MTFSLRKVEITTETFEAGGRGAARPIGVLGAMRTLDAARFSRTIYDTRTYPGCKSFVIYHGLARREKGDSHRILGGRGRKLR
jgi:hypothetical protein